MPFDKPPVIQWAKRLLKKSKTCLCKTAVIKMNNMGQKNVQIKTCCLKKKYEKLIWDKNVQN